MNICVRKLLKCKIKFYSLRDFKFIDYLIFLIDILEDYLNHLTATQTASKFAKKHGPISMISTKQIVFYTTQDRLSLQHLFIWLY